MGFLSAQDTNQSKTLFSGIQKNFILFFRFLLLKCKYPDEHSSDVISVLCELERKLHFNRSQRIENAKQ